MKRVCSIFFLLAIYIGTPKAFAFLDLSSDDNQSAIQYLYAENIVDGYSDGTYRPKNSINRAELLKILIKSKVGEISVTNENCFTDVSDDWYAKYVCYAKEQGWVIGYKDGTFKPGKNINRAEAIAMMMKIYSENISLKSGDISYADVSSSAWYVDYLFTAKLAGILDSNSYFHPSNEITRGDLASALYRLLINTNTSDTILFAEDVTVESPAVVIPELIDLNPFSGVSLYVDPDSNAKSNPDLLQISSQATAKWFGDWSGDIESATSDYVSTVTKTGALPVMVIYNIPGRDCGNYSSGGSSDSSNYQNWIKNFANGVGNREAVVILEPDALPLDCLYKNSETLLFDAVTTLKSKTGISVYIDAGHPNWNSASEMASRLKLANIANADGFSLNVSNFYTTEENIKYGEEISALVGDKHFIIDTGRNGSGWKGEWCNPSGMSLGENPTISTGHDLVDAYLWIKPPGESDGNCNGGPSAGSWWLEYALDLIGN